MEIKIMMRILLAYLPQAKKNSHHNFDLHATCWSILSSFVRPIEVAYSNYKYVDWNPQRECIVIDFNQLKVESSKILVMVPSKNSYVTCFYHSLACMFCVGACRENDCNLDFIFLELFYFPTNSPVRTILKFIDIITTHAYWSMQT